MRNAWERPGPGPSNGLAVKKHGFFPRPMRGGWQLEAQLLDVSPGHWPACTCGSWAAACVP